MWRTGEIKLVETETPTPDGSVNFSIAIGEQFYMINAESKELAEFWVDGLRLRQIKPIENPPETSHAMITPLEVIPPPPPAASSSIPVVKKEKAPPVVDVVS